MHNSSRLAIALAFLSSSAVADTTQQLLQKADQAIAKSEFSTALIHLKNAAKQDSGNRDTHLKLAHLFVKTGQGLQALEEIKRVERLNGTPEEITLLRAHALYLMGEYQQIIDQDELLSLPQSHIARYRAMQGHAFFAQRKFEQARRMFERAKALGSNELEVQLGQIKLLRLGENKAQEKALVESLLHQYPANADVLIEAGAYFQSTDQFDRALDMYRQAGEIQASNINIWFGTVRSYIGQGNYAEARREAEKIIKAYPEHQVANYLLAVIEFEDGNYQRARSAAELVLKGDKRDFEAMLLLASIQFQLKDYSNAEDSLKKFLTSFPGNESALKTLAAVYIKRKQGARALEVLLPLEPLNSAYINSMISSAYLLAGNTEKSDEYLAKSLQIAPEDDVLKRRFQRNKLEAGESLKLEFSDTDYNNFINEGHIAILDRIVQQRFDEAERITRGYMQTMPKFHVLHYLLGTIHLGQNKVDEAKAAFEESLKIKSDFIESRIYLAKIYLRTGDDRSAEREYREVLKFSENYDEALVGLAGIADRAGKEEDMIKWLVRSQKRNHGSLASREVLERHFRERGDIAKAVEIAQEMVDIQPQNIKLLRRLALNQKANGRLDLAIRTFERIVKLNPDSIAALAGLGHMQYLNDEYLPAAKTYTRVLELDPKHLMAQVVLTQLDLKFGRVPEALARAKKLQAMHPEHSAGYDMLGDVYIRMKEPAKAIPMYAKSAEIRYNSETYLKLLTAYNRNKQVDKGFEMLKGWVKQFPKDLALKEALAVTYSRRGDNEESLKLYEQILDADLNNDRVLNKMAMVALALQSPMSMEYAEKAYRIEPNNAKNADTLGWVLLNNKSIDKSLDLLEQAVKREPSNSDYRYHFAVALAEIGRKRDALTQLYLATGSPEFFPNRVAASKLIEKLSQPAN